MACQIQLVCSLTDRTLAGKEGPIWKSRMRLFFLPLRSVGTKPPMNRIRPPLDLLNRPAAASSVGLRLLVLFISILNIPIISYLQRNNSRTNLLELSPFNRRALQMAYIYIQGGWQDFEFGGARFTKKKGHFRSKRWPEVQMARSPDIQKSRWSDSQKTREANSVKPYTFPLES